MGKVNINITFDKELLTKLVNEQNACVSVYKKLYHLALHPFHLTNLSSSIKEILNEKIAKYDKTLDGILLGYQNIKLLDAAGAINFDSSFIHTNIEADFYIFKPAIGQILNGVVNKKSKDHVGCLVHKTFNVSLPKQENCEEWIGHSAQLGQEIQFEITYTDLDGRLPYIKGKILSLLSDDSGFSTSEEPNCQQNTITKFSESDTEVTHELIEKKKRKRESNNSLSETETKSKKIKHNHNDDNEKYGNETPSSKQHKHKVKKRESPNENDVYQETHDYEVEKLASNFDVKMKKHKHKKDLNIETKYNDKNIAVDTGKKQNNLDEIFAHNDDKKISKERKKKENKYSHEITELGSTEIDTEEKTKNIQKKKKHKHKKDSERETIVNNVSFKSDISFDHKKNEYLEDFKNIHSELTAFVKKKKKRKSHE